MCDLMEQTMFAKVARRKLGPLPSGFQIYQAGWLGEKPEDWHAMKVTGAEFRVATRGKNKGQLTVMVPGTKRSAIVTREELRDEELTVNA